LLKLGFKALEQGEGICSRASETDDYLAVGYAPNFRSVRFNYCRTKADLSIARDNYLVVFANRDNRRTVPGVRLAHGSVRNY
jgi:hypothetical protein